MTAADPIALAAAGMAAALRERCPGCKGRWPLSIRMDGAHHVTEREPTGFIQCRLYDDERLALAAYLKAGGA